MGVEDDSLVDGLPFSVRDGSASDSESYYAGLHIIPIGNYSDQERYVYADYLHTWDTEYTTYDASVSYPGGVSMNFNTSETVKTERTTTEGDGDTFMKLNQYQAESPSSP